MIMYLEKKRIGKKDYFYLRQSYRENGKVKTKTISYLGIKQPNKEELKKAIKNAENASEFNTNAGEIIVLTTKQNEEIRGTILPSFDNKILLIKLKSGYNIGIEKSSIKSIIKTGHAEEIKFPEINIEQKKNLPGISMIITGGTIGAKVDYATGAVKWLNKPNELFAISPGMLNVVDINDIEVPFTIGSENMAPKNWINIAKIAAKFLNKKENKGLIITHGTDTLHYTAAALSFMLKNLNKPVILTYSQRSPDRGSTDAALNLICAAQMAKSNIAEVMLVGHGSIEDNYCLAIRGTKVRKMHTSRRDTFRPINDLPIAKISENGHIEIINENFRKIDEKKNSEVIADTKFEEKIALIKYCPGADSDILNYYISKKYKGIIIEMTGLGQLATSESEMNWLPLIKKAIENGITICAAAQTLYGRLDPFVYSTGREIEQLGVIYLEDILPETAYVKLGFVLGHTSNKEKIKEMILENIAGEFNKRIEEKTFLY